MFGIPTDDELDKEYQQDLDYINKQKDARRERTLSRRTKVRALVDDIEDWIKNNNSNLLKVVTKLLNNPNILSVNTYKWENRVAKKTGHSSLSFWFRDKSSFEINNYIKINMLDGSYKFDFKIEANNFTSYNDPCYILTNLIEILNNLDVDSFIEEVINDNKEITNSEQYFIDRFISQPNRITSIKDCENGGHWAHGGKFFIFTVDNKYVYHFESYDSGAYSGDHTNTLRCFNEIDRKSNGNYSYDSQVVKKIDINSTGLEIENRRGQVNIVGGKIDVDKLISQSK